MDRRGAAGGTAGQKVRCRRLTNLLQATRLCLCPKRSRSVTCAKRSEAARKESEANASEGEVTAVATQRKRLPANATPACRLHPPRPLS